MNRITLENYRCFREKQDVVLAPLTLLVGDNSTGKTSFLAMIRALWNRAVAVDDPSFKDPPYDLGSFDEIAHYRGGRGGRADSFLGGFDFETTGPPPMTRSISAIYRGVGTVAFPVETRLSGDEERVWIKVVRDVPGQSWQLSFGTERGEWSVDLGRLGLGELPLPLVSVSWLLEPQGPLLGNGNGRLASGTAEITDDDWHRLRILTDDDCFSYYRPGSLYASAPVRSRPRRTYDPSNLARDPEGDHVPLFLANMSLQASSPWKDIKKELEGFGKRSGLFDEIRVRRLGSRSSEPFQLQMRKFGATSKGPMRNMIDVGYGVSQVLPVLVELFRENSATAFLLQQPEVHLHPSAQAALGTLFCTAAATGRRLFVETHSDHLMDRVRMDVRDGGTGLRPEDVSILFFERRNLGVQIHSLRIDGEGNVLDAPLSYRQFFMDETQRSLRL